MRLSVLAAACLVPALLLGCAKKSQTVEQPTDPAATENTSVPTMNLDEVRSVDILGKAAGDQLEGIDQTVTRLTEQQFDELQLARPGFTPDFGKHDVILLTLGQQPTGGYRTDITALQLVGNTLYVQATATAPPSDESGNVTQVITHPFSAVVVDKLPADLTLRSDITSVLQ